MQEQTNFSDFNDFNMVDLIMKKKRGQELLEEEINFIVDGYTKGNIPDYQISAWLMAVCFEDMTPNETSYLTKAFINSGNTLDLSSIRGIKVDKHSTGGVGDKTTLIILPLVASLKIPVAKMSGRGLGYTGGTIDKLSSIPSFNTNLTEEDFLSQLKEHYMALAGQTKNLVPADKKFYTLRDVTATVESIPLIASSIMSKKIALGADRIALDVKVGSGAFMKDLSMARKLAETMVNIGTSLGRKTVAIISNMQEPLGREIGNLNEVKEAILILKGKGDKRLRELCLELASQMTVLGDKFSDPQKARTALEEILQNGTALSTFKKLITLQGGNPDFVDNPNILPKPAYSLKLDCPQDGYIKELDAEKIGILAMHLGAGRQKKEDSIDPLAGISLNFKTGEKVQKGDTLLRLFSNKPIAPQLIDLALDAYSLSPKKPDLSPLILDIIKPWRDCFRCSL